MKDVLRDRRYLVLVGSALVGFSVVVGGWAWLLAWPGVTAFALGFAHMIGAHGLFGKRPDGKLAVVNSIALLPLLAVLYLVWHRRRRSNPEPAVTLVDRELAIGRRLLPDEPVQLDRSAPDADIGANGGPLAASFDNIVDLAAEFAEPPAISRLPGYRSFPILNGAAPNPAALREVVASLPAGRTFVHCGYGHGRAALFAVALMLATGRANTIDDAMDALRRVRPRVRLNDKQRRCLEACLSEMRCDAPTQRVGPVV
jgi:MYXO-CTERM domain-containing protein